MKMIQKYKLYQDIKKSNAPLNWAAHARGNEISIQMPTCKVSAQWQEKDYDGEKVAPYSLFVKNNTQQNGKTYYGIFARAMYYMMHEKYVEALGRAK